MKSELVDRFGHIPPQVEDLFVTVKSRKLAVDLGFEKMSLKNNVLRCHFINRPDSPYFESNLFNRVIQYLQAGTNKGRLKQTGRLFLLVVEPVNSMEEAHRFLSGLHKFCFDKAKIANDADC
jgi:transcription-repair coupling factor (superfamily II helicase)